MTKNRRYNSLTIQVLWALYYKRFPQLLRSNNIRTWNTIPPYSFGSVLIESIQTINNLGLGNIYYQFENYEITPLGFIILLLNQQHITPAFLKAIDPLGKCKPLPVPEVEDDKDSL